MEYIKIMMLAFCIVLISQENVEAQPFYRGEQMTIKPSQIIIGNYSAISIGNSAPQSNEFDKQNVYTYLQLIYDDAGRSSQIIYQTDFFGKILYLAFSNDLQPVFHKPEKPMNAFLTCIKQVNSFISPVQNIDIAIKCILERLNYCSG